jgi:hypothetical protein
MINSNILLGFTFFLLFSACDSEKTMKEKVVVNSMVITEPAPHSENNSSLKFDAVSYYANYASSVGIVDVNQKEVNKTNVKKIIKDGRLTIKTLEIVKSKKNIDNVVNELNGYYENESFINSDIKMSFNLTIRVPSDNFEKLLQNVESGNEEIINKEINARDVTEEFIDIESRLKNKKEYLKRYKELLIKALTVKDILSIEENIRVLQEEIESNEGRFKYLNDQVDFSTLKINLFLEKAYVFKPIDQDNFSERTKKALSKGWNSVIDFLLWFISLWPIIVLVIILWILIKRFLKKRKSIQS